MTLAKPPPVSLLAHCLESKLKTMTFYFIERALLFKVLLVSHVYWIVLNVVKEYLFRLIQSPAPTTLVWTKTIRE